MPRVPFTGERTPAVALEQHLTLRAADDLEWLKGMPRRQRTELRTGYGRAEVALDDRGLACS